MIEAELIEQVRNGHTERYGDLIERYEKGLINHCFRMLGDAELARDVAQETFIRAFLQIKHYQPTYRFSTWLYRIATNLCLDYLRRKHHLSLEDVPEPRSPLPTPHEQAITHSEAEGLHRAVRSLQVRYQSVISLYYWEQQSYAEIAQIMDVPIGTVRTWLRRAKAELKEKLRG